jgi:hypothetical protein
MKYLAIVTLIFGSTSGASAETKSKQTPVFSCEGDSFKITQLSETRVSFENGPLEYQLNLKDGVFREVQATAFGSIEYFFFKTGSTSGILTILKNEPKRKESVSSVICRAKI